MDASNLRVAQLKELLRKRQLSTTGCKTELIARLQMTDPEGQWMQDSTIVEESAAASIEDGEGEEDFPAEPRQDMRDKRYETSEDNTRELEFLRLKGRALEWFHSRPEHIGLSVDEILMEMKKMFDQQQSILKWRKQFEERVWKTGESFSAYFHEKIILANRVPIEEEELTEYLVEGITSTQLRNQARLQQF
ncbi:uncharacterized protein LOC116852956 [Odontomachus brunneus]|uniref:uncharacterized protein LOC116852956 n=1 Tax=Odontomachus brunneus TaxID=486640 RepID=UPI0013F2A882|nr:uncharacterized protein LOC116852956 [Odontomachus brunneus]